jgi:hypothetical protein
VPTTEKTRKILTDFSSNDEEKHSKWSLSEIKEALADLGWRDEGASFKVRMMQRVEDLEKTKEREYSSKRSAMGYVVALAIALIAAFIGGALVF